MPWAVEHLILHQRDWVSVLRLETRSVHARVCGTTPWVSEGPGVTTIMLRGSAFLEYATLSQTQ